MPVSSWSTIPGNNNAAPPNGAPEGMAPGNVNDVIRQIMADVRSFYDGLNSVDAPTTQNANYTLAIADIAPGLLHTDASNYAWTLPPNSSVAIPVGATISLVNQGSGTITVTPGVGVTLYPFGNPANIAGAFGLTGYVSALLKKVSTDTWIALTQHTVGVANGSFTASLSTGFSGSPTGTLNYYRTGHIVTLYTAAGFTSTSNATNFGISGVPAAISPTANRISPCLLTDNGATLGGWGSINSAGQIAFAAGFNYNVSGFTSSGNKGFPGGFQLAYSL